MKSARTLFDMNIRDKGLRQTRQRQIILDAFLSAGRHVTAQDLHNIVSVDHPDIGFATVSRNLNLFLELDIAEEIKVGTKKTRYEPKTEGGHHDHLICVKCGRFTEFCDPKIEKLQEKIAEAKGFTPIRHKLEIYGTCRECT